jgi:hypothetical protein
VISHSSIQFSPSLAINRHDQDVYVSLAQTNVLKVLPEKCLTLPEPGLLVYMATISEI